VDQEVWKPYPGDERYSVSNHGRAIGPKGHLLSLQRGSGGLLHFWVSTTENGKQTNRAVIVGRAVLETFEGPCPHEGWYAAHKNKVVDDNYVENLEWQSPEQVQLETTAMGRHGKGSEKACAVLNEEQVEEIRDWWDCDTYSMSELARMFGVSLATISNIINYKSWKHVN